MILNKGFHTDTKELDQPEGTWRDAKNAIYDESKLALSNEEGFLQISKLIPSGKTYNGHVEADDYIVVFLYDATTDEIGLIDSNGRYTTLLADNDLKFNSDYPVKGEYIKLESGARYVIFTDYLNSLRVINLDNPDSSSDLRQLDLISPISNRLTINSSVISGGSIPQGSYSIATRYVNKNGIKTNVVFEDRRLFVSQLNIFGDKRFATETGGNSGKAINISLSSIDTSYEYIEIFLIGYTSETLSAIRVARDKITGSSKTYIVSEFRGTTFTITDLIKTKKSQIVNDLTIADDSIYAGPGIREEEEIDFQQYANLIEVNYTHSLSLVSTVDVPFNSLMPGEVYALYFSLVYHDDRETRLFHIPGREAESGETSTSSYTNTVESGSSYKKFHIEDTSDNGSASTNMGYWENEDEVYPNTEQFDSSGIGGSDLRGTPVRHHKLPSLKKLKTEHYSANSTFGASYLPILGFELDNIVIPSSIASKVKGYKVYYAKRTVSNMCVLGYAPLLYMGKFTNPLIGATVTDDMVVSITGNHGVELSSANEKTVQINETAIKFQAFDLLKSKPKITPKFIYNELLSTLDMTGFAASSSVLGSLSGVSYHVGDKYFGFHKATESTPTAVVDAKQIRGITKYSYVPENTIFGDIYNRYGEEILLLRGDFSSVITTPPERYSGNEEINLSSLRQIPLNVYSSFYEQNDFVPFGKGVISGAGTINNQTFTNIGDVQPCVDEIINTAGLYGSSYPVDADGSAKGLGSMALRVVLTYSVNNTFARIEDPSNPQTVLRDISNDASTLTVCNEYDPTLPRPIEIDSSLSYEPIYRSLIAFNPFEEFRYDHSSRIIRFTAIDRESNELTIEYLPNSYYEMPKNKGRGVGINRVGENLIIRHEKTSYITRGKQFVELGEGEASIGNNDIFDIPPEPILDTNDYTFGSQSKFAAIVTKYGIVSVDGITGKIFLFSPGSAPKEISKEGRYNFFRDRLKTVEGLINIVTYASVGISNYTFGSTTKMLLTITRSSAYPTRYHFLEGEVCYINSLDVYGKINKIRSDDTNVYLYLDNTYASTSTQTVYHYSTVDSPYQNNGIVLGYDQDNERILITKKHTNGIPFPKEYIGVYSSDILTALSDEQIVRQGNTFKKKSGVSLVNLDAGSKDSSLINKSFTNSFSLERNFWVSDHDYIPTSYIQSKEGLLNVYNDEIWKMKGGAMCDFYGTVYDFYIEVIHNKNPTLTKKFKELYWVAPFYLNDVYTASKTFSTIQLFTLEYQKSQNSNEVTLTNFASLASLGNQRNITGTWHFNMIRDDSNNKLFSKFLQTILKYSNSDNYKLFLYEINSKFNYVKN